MPLQIVSLITPAFALLFACLFSYLWLSDRSKLHILGYATGYAALVLSYVLVVMVFDGKSPGMTIAVSTISWLGAVAIVWGATRRIGVVSPWVGYLAIGVLMALFTTLSAIWSQPRVLMLAQNTGSSLIFALGALLLWSANSARTLDRALIWTMALFAAHGFSRPLQAMLVEHSLESLRFGVSTFQAINVVIIGVLSVLMAMIMLAGVVQDTMQRERAEATIDPLSGLLTRRAFEAEVAATLARGKAEGIPISLIVADIDRFKRINDELGHAVGDMIIRSFGQLIAGNIRPNDIAGRVGGEEFCIVVWNCNAEQAHVLAERIRTATMGLRAINGDTDIIVTASFGVAGFGPGMSYHDVFVQADKALYSCKNGGRNQVCRVDQPDLSALEFAPSNVVPLAR